MARTRTLTQLIADVRHRADIENSLHITDTQLTRDINQSGAALHALLVEHCEDEFVEVVSGTAGTPVDNVTEIDMSPGMYRLVAVHLNISGRLVPLERWKWMQEPIVFDTTVTGPPYRYRLTKDKLRIFPAAPVGTAARFFVIPPYVDLASGSDTLDGRDGWEEWIVWDAAIKSMVKEETSTREAVFERDQVLTRIKSQMKARDFARPDTMVDVEGADTVWPFPLPVGG